MKVFGNIDFAASGHVFPDEDIGDDRVAIASSPIAYSFGQPLSVIGGMSLTPGVGAHLMSFNGQYTYSPSNITTSVKADLAALRIYLKAITPTNTTHPLTFGTGETLTPGVYQIEGAASIAGTLILDAQDNPDALFIIRCTGAFSTGAGSVVSLANQAKSANVFWVSTGAVSIGAATVIKGTIISDAALGFGDGCNVAGRAFSISGALAFTNIHFLPLTPGPFDAQFGSLITFSAFTSLGAISNTGSSEIYGDIGTNAGAITGLETSTLHGTSYVSVDSSFNAEMGIYLNSVLIPHSVRTFVHGGSGSGAASLTCLSGLISAGQSIEVRVRVTLGSMSIGNRCFSSQKFMGLA